MTEKEVKDVNYTIHKIRCCCKEKWGGIKGLFKAGDMSKKCKFDTKWQSLNHQMAKNDGSQSATSNGWGCQDYKIL